MGDTSKKDDTDYDPHKERNLPNPLNDWESMLHIIKGILGTGILAMPEVFKNSGIFLGFVSTILNGFFCTYGVHILVGCLYTLGKRNKLPVVSYSEGMELGFSQGPPWAEKRSYFVRIVTDVFLIVFQISACCVYALFVVLNIKLVVDIHLKEEWNLKILVPFSLLANVIMLLTIGVVFYYVFETPLPPITEQPFFQSSRRLPLAFGTTCFAFSSIAVAVAVENTMKKPGHFGGLFGVYNRSVFIIMVLYIAMAFLGFWRFGEDVKPSITLNFPPKVIISQVVNSLYAIGIYISYGLNAFVPINLIKEYYLDKHLEDSKWKTAWEYLLRFLLVTTTIILAASLPMPGLLMSLFGAVSLSALAFIFPALLDFCVRYPDGYGPLNIYKWRDIFMIIYGIIGLITTVSVAVWEICGGLQKMYGV